MHHNCEIAGSTPPGVFLQAFYSTQADRNAAQAKFHELTDAAEKANACSFVVTDCGDCGLTMFAIFRDSDGWSATNAPAAADASFGEILCGKALLVDATCFGDLKPGFWPEMQAWDDAYRQFTWSKKKCLDSYGTAFSPVGAYVGYQYIAWKSPEDRVSAAMTGSNTPSA